MFTPNYAWTIGKNNKDAFSTDMPSVCDRRTTLKTGIAFTATAVGVISNNPLPAFAVESDLSKFQDGPRGLKYQILKEGEGESPVRGQKIEAKYTLWTGSFGEDGGKQVDSNTGFLGRPFGVNVGVGNVIKGWDLTLLDMKVGEIRRIVVPSDLGYGDRGAGGAIPPKATLYFELEMTKMDNMIELNDQQKQWLQDHPL